MIIDAITFDDFMVNCSWRKEFFLERKYFIKIGLIYLLNLL